MSSPLAPLISNQLIAIALLTLMVMGFGLMVGILIAERKAPPAQTSRFEVPRGLTLLSPTKLRRLVIKTIVLLAIGIILLAYGYGSGQALVRAMGYLSVFFAFTLLGKLLTQLNV